MMKRSRQARAEISATGWSRNCRHLVMITAWMTSTDAVQAPAVTAPVHRLDSRPMVATRSSITSEADSRFCAYCRSSS